MKSETSARIEELFLRALELEGRGREELLEEVRRESPRFHKELASLLRFHEKSAFLDTPPVGSEASERMAHETRVRKEAGRLIGRRMGAYEIRFLLGHGGMGTVYLAARVDGAFEKDVALKIIRPGLHGQSIVAQFQRERDVLARLDHPHIAHLVDGGTTEDELAFLVMEYVAGKPITVYCDENRLTLEKRIDLFLSVCSAVQYAHRSLVLHCDLKPNNILVSSDGVPKLLDFGIAKLMRADPDVSQPFAMTTSGNFLTPDSASPEQVRGEPMTTASDVYSLGIVLYELLCGRKPYRLGGLAPAQIEQVVCVDEPPKASAAVHIVDEPTANGQGGDARSKNKARSLEGSDRLRRRLSGDLDSIVLKALRKKPEARFASVEHFAEDLRRYQNGRPVLARRGTWTYRMSRFLALNRIKVAMTVLLVLSLVVLLVAYTKESQMVRHEQAAARIQTTLTELLREPARGVTLRDEVRRTLERQDVEELAVLLADQPDELIRYAKTNVEVSERFHLLDLEVRWRKILLDAQDAESPRALLEMARALRKTVARAEARRCLDRAESLLSAFLEDADLPALLIRERALVLSDEGLWSAAVDLLRDGELRARDGNARAAQFECALDRASLLGDLGRIDEAFRVLEGAGSVARSLLDRSRVDRVLASLLWRTPRFARVEQALRRALDGIYRTEGRESPRVADCLNDLASHAFSSRRKAALPLWSEGYRLRRASFGERSIALADTLHVYRKLRRSIESRRLGEEALSILRERYPEDHPWVVQVEAAVAKCPQTLGSASIEKRCSELQRVIGKLSGIFPPGHIEVAVHKRDLAKLLHTAGRFGEAARLLESCFPVFEEVLGWTHPETASLLKYLILVYERCGREAETGPFQNRLSLSEAKWPFGDVYKNHDFTREYLAGIDFEDDHLEKIIVVPKPLEDNAFVQLWICGSPSHQAWREFGDIDNYAIRVNRKSEQEIHFNLGRAFCYLTETFQWIPFSVPAGWLVEGANHFMIFKDHDPDYSKTYSWTTDVLSIGIDRDHDEDQSWWLGGASYSCCSSLAREVELAPKPLDPEDPIFMNHRDQGFRECRGELMIFLSVSP